MTLTCDTPMNDSLRRNVHFSRHVHFSSQIVEISSPSAPSLSLSEDDIASRWWTPMEMTQFRQSAKQSSRDSRLKPWMTKSFERAYSRSRRVAELCDDENESKLLLELQNIKVTDDLVDWCQFGHRKRGLERWSSIPHNALRSHQVTAAKRQVLALNDAILIRRTSEKFSRTARVFARLVGQADAEAVCNPEPFKQEMELYGYMIYALSSSKITTSSQPASQPIFIHKANELLCALE